MGWWAVLGKVANIVSEVQAATGSGKKPGDSKMGTLKTLYGAVANKGGTTTADSSMLESLQSRRRRDTGFYSHNKVKGMKQDSSGFYKHSKKVGNTLF